MNKNPINSFKKEREELNEFVMKYADKKIKRFYSLDSQSYRGDALSTKTKELLGLVASLVLRCDDCIKYHLIRCYEEGITDKELEESVSIALIVGGSIVVPHMRRLFKLWDEIQSNENNEI